MSSSTTDTTPDTSDSTQSCGVTSPASYSTKSTGSIVTVTSTTSPRIHVPSNITRPSLPRRAVSEGVNLIKPGAVGNGNFSNLGIAGKYSSLAEVNGHGSPYNDHSKDKSMIGQPVRPEERRTSEDLRVHAAGEQNLFVCPCLYWFVCLYLFVYSVVSLFLCLFGLFVCLFVCTCLFFSLFIHVCLFVCTC